jgi:hypothetical protein
MALTVTYDTDVGGPTNAESRSGPSGRHYKIVTGTIAFDSSYPTGGEALDLTSYFDSLKVVLLETAAGYTLEYDNVNKKVKVFYADYSTGTDGALIEVASTTDLATVLAEVRFVAFGL